MKDPDRTKPPETDNEKNSGVSRRLFLRGSGAAAAAATLTRPIAEAAESDAIAPVDGPGAVPVVLTINGENQELKVEPRVTLLDAMRNQLDITGAKRVCDRGTCGACTVVIDNKPVYACSVLAIEAQGKPIRTIESLGVDHPMVKAFVENDAQQCGFCTPGFVMACTVFAENNPAPSLEDVKNGLGGNLCRCGTYSGIKPAVLDAAKAMKGGR